MNKMFVMLPVLYASRKIDGDDETTVLYLRIAYCVAQFLMIIITLFMYFKANSLKNSKDGDEVIYVAPAAQPFADPNEKKKYTQVKYGEHVLSQVTSLIGSTLFGTVFTVGLHIYRGAVVGLAMQAVMGPFGLFESPLVKLFFFGKSKVFDEKTKDELAADDEIIDKDGNAIKASTKDTAAAITSKNQEDKQKTTTTETKKSFEDMLLDTWDEGSEADIIPLMKAVNKTNINFRTSENSWTPLMILSGLGAKNCTEAMKSLKILGADPTLIDGEGWNAMHWAAYHGSVDAVKVLDEAFNAVKGDQLHLVKDKEGKIPLDHAKSEGNDGSRLELEKIMKDDACVIDDEQDEGLRKRK